MTSTGTFIEYREGARKRSVALLVAFWVVVAFEIYLLCLPGAWYYLHSIADEYNVHVGLAIHLFDPTVLLMWSIVVSQLICLFVSLVTYYNFIDLKQGGRVIAERFGAKLLSPFSPDFRQRRVINVVQEMALACGLSVPKVYVLPHQEGINSFVAGYESDDAVICLTSGAIEKLEREELQAIVAHEFSHLLYGDTRFNLLLLSLFKVILVFTSTALKVLNLLSWKAFLEKKKIEEISELQRQTLGIWLTVMFPLILIVVVFYVIGFIGLVCSRVVKAAFCREREFLSDAVAVQLTRNSWALVSALNKIRQNKKGSRVNHPLVEECNHYFFANPQLTPWWASAHPKIIKRIKRYEPGFDEIHASSGLGKESAGGYNEKEEAIGAAGTSLFMGASGSEKILDGFSGTGLDFVTLSFPTPLLHAAEEGLGAKALVYAYLLELETDIADLQQSYLAEHESAELLQELQRLRPILEGLSIEARLPLLEIALSSLHDLSQHQADELLTHLRYLISADDHVSLYEALILCRVMHLFSKSSRESAISAKRRAEAAAQVLFAIASRADNVVRVDELFNRGVKLLDISVEDKDPTPVDSEGLARALEDLRGTVISFKHRLMGAVLLCMKEGEELRRGEELYRLIAAAIDYPVPRNLSFHSHDSDIEEA